MKVDASAPPRPAPAAAAVRRTPHPRAFGAALVLARTRGESAPLPQSGLVSSAASMLTLTRRRSGADEAQRKLSERREDAEPCAARPHEGRTQLISADLCPRGASPAAPLVTASAVERLAMEIGKMSGRPFVEMSFGRDLHVRITRSPRGVEVLLQAGGETRGAALAELPGFVAALRARGVAVASARVLGEPAASRPRALTPRRGSATNAATSYPAGTVAKW